MARHGGEITAAFPGGGGGIAGASTAATTPAASPYQVTDARALPSPSLLFSLCLRGGRARSCDFCFRTHAEIEAESLKLALK